MTQEDVVRRIIEQNRCFVVSCHGRTGSWNQGVECPFNAGDGGCGSGDEIFSKAKVWLDERELPSYSSTFTIAHRFKPGDRVQYKNAAEPHVMTVEKVELLPDYGAIYRFASDGECNMTGVVSRCDENLRLADCEEEAEKAKKMP